MLPSVEVQNLAGRQVAVQYLEIGLPIPFQQRYADKSGAVKNIFSLPSNAMNCSEHGFAAVQMRFGLIATGPRILNPMEKDKRVPTTNKGHNSCSTSVEGKKMLSPAPSISTQQ